MLRFTLAAGALLFITACSSPYLKNRGRDTLDIVTFQLETRSYGASLRAGPVKAGLNYQSSKGSSVGLRGGDAGVHGGEEVTFFFVGRDVFGKSAPAGAEDSADSPAAAEPAGTAEPSAAPEAEPSSDSQSIPDPMIQNRGKAFASFSPFGTTLPAYRKRSVFKTKGGFAPAYYYTQLEVSVGLFLGLRIGLNPGELVDALAGIFSLDPFSDDEPFKTDEEKALEENPLYNSLNDEQKRAFREALKKRGGL